jgi:hypothetical protein
MERRGETGQLPSALRTSRRTMSSPRRASRSSLARARSTRPVISSALVVETDSDVAPVSSASAPVPRMRSRYSSERRLTTTMSSPRRASRSSLARARSTRPVISSALWPSCCSVQRQTWERLVLISYTRGVSPNALLCSQWSAEERPRRTMSSPRRASRSSLARARSTRPVISSALWPSCCGDRQRRRPCKQCVSACTADEEPL